MEVACAGKVLVTGGYLVLYPEYSGLVLATSCKIRSRLEATAGPPEITVRSEHFDKTWVFPWTPLSPAHETDNPFVAASVATVTTVAALCRS